eukprot:CAMPEP_0185570304 /NCGR_PEP_ID=MMETSP0434-20130131/2669_1 /TAXON_ID=626734 ORGANISM="Favella taraikaensis, Strain Fe Narragansett Bay" /NCGR_SAMPLE_ID=MMETSP0434 /ASSEMBLY_ACC=CAM_ASM_000379 /LENGTH=47 /DNA_ID= /DNA_START= /DNA_END= /DNA_ORIENTATION=
MSNQAVRRVYKREGLGGANSQQPIGIRQAASARMTNGKSGEVVSVSA